MKDFELGLTFEDGNVSIEVSKVAIRFYAQQAVDCTTKTIPIDLTLQELHSFSRMIMHAAAEAQALYFDYEENDSCA